MTQITASQVKELRERTGLGMMECKKALVESNGNLEQAIDQLRKSSVVKAAKKAGRIAAEGVIRTAIDGNKAVIVEVNCETDFVAKDTAFLAFTDAVVEHARKQTTTDIGVILNDDLAGRREQLVQKIGENISLRRVARIEAQNGKIYSYIHNNKIGVLVALDKAVDELGKDIAMHIAASSPLAIQPEDIDQDLIAREREIYREQAKNSGKPENIVEKMVAGRIQKYLAETSLTRQPFVKDMDVSIGKLLEKQQCAVTAFCRFEVGEGIEKSQVDFAEEVKQQAGL